MSALLSTFFAAIIPATAKRSVAGSYDNESNSIFGLVIAVYFWLKATKSASKYIIANSIVAAFAFFFLASSWGGFVFVHCLIPLHVAVLFMC